MKPKTRRVPAKALEQSAAEAEARLARERLAATVDELGALEQKIRGDLERITALRKDLAARAEDSDGAAPVEFWGYKFVALLTPKASVRTVDVRAVYAALGDEKFLAIARVTIKDVEAALTPAECAAAISQPEHKGARTVRTIARNSDAGIGSGMKSI